MRFEVFSYRFAAEIMQHSSYRQAWDEITQVVADAPLYIWPNKSRKKKGLDVLQLVMNSHFDMAFAKLGGWDYHPLATNIAGSNLRADFRKVFACASERPLAVQVEVQLGNMARWYSDVFKFQAAYSEGLAQVGVCVIPTAGLARRIDQNVVSFERAVRELPSAELSITLPILMLGLSPDADTEVLDISRSRFGEPKDFSSRGKGAANRSRVLNGLSRGLSVAELGPETDVGEVYEALPEDEPLETE